MLPLEGSVIACAGLGSRLGLGLPKCLIEIGGRTILSRLIESLQTKVDRIHVVVGYREELVIEHCARHHRDVVIVRNPMYRDTNTAYSLRLGSIGFKSKVLYVDGDLIIDDRSLSRFISRGEGLNLLVGITQAKSSQAVFVSTSGIGEEAVVRGFHRKPTSGQEWANIFIGAPEVLAQGTGYVYECLEPHLPVAAQEVDLFEVDTPEDLAGAKACWATTGEVG